MKTATGQYTIRFTPPFRAPPTVTVSAEFTGAVFATVINQATADQVGIGVYISSTAALVDSVFGIQARGLA